MRLIKRYKNRRLYDTEASRTITQKDLAGLIQTGETVTVIDSASGQDITLEVLSRVAISEPVVRATYKRRPSFFETPSF